MNKHQLAASQSNHVHNKKVNDKELLENIKQVAMYFREWGFAVLFVYCGSIFEIMVTDTNSRL